MDENKNTWLSIAEKLRYMSINEIADTLSVACENIKNEWYTVGFKAGYKSGQESKELFNKLDLK